MRNTVRLLSVVVAVGLSVAATSLSGFAAPTTASQGTLKAPTRAAPKIDAIAAGGDSTCIIISGGLWCWGDNPDGKLGDGTETYRKLPVRVKGMKKQVVSVSVGEYHACALKQDGSAWCWGNNSDGQLGDGTTKNRLKPVKVKNLGKTRAISAGFHTCAITRANVAKCWGNNSYGGLGDGSTENRSKPVKVKKLKKNVASVTAGQRQSCAVLTTGAARCWGGNYGGQLGDGSTDERHTPVPVKTLGKTASTISAGDPITCATTKAGKAKCWGSRQYGGLGDGSDVDLSSTPVQVAGLTPGVSQILARYHFGCAVLKGKAACWGHASRGQLGIGSDGDSLVPVAVHKLGKGVTTIAGGYSHACALKKNGVAMCWGANGYGQLGDGSIDDRWEPVKVKVPS